MVSFVGFHYQNQTVIQEVSEQQTTQPAPLGILAFKLSHEKQCIPNKWNDFYSMNCITYINVFIDFICANLLHYTWFLDNFIQCFWIIFSHLVVQTSLPFKILICNLSLIIFNCQLLPWDFPFQCARINEWLVRAENRTKRKPSIRLGKPQRTLGGPGNLLGWDTKTDTQFVAGLWLQ